MTSHVQKLIAVKYHLSDAAHILSTIGPEGNNEFVCKDRSLALVREAEAWVQHAIEENILWEIKGGDVQVMKALLISLIPIISGLSRGTHPVENTRKD